MSERELRTWTGSSSVGGEGAKPNSPNEPPDLMAAERTPELVLPSRDEEAGILEDLVPEAQPQPAGDDVEGGNGSPAPVSAGTEGSSRWGRRGLHLLLLALVLAVVVQGVFIGVRLLGLGATAEAVTDGQIFVDSRPSGADVVIDGELRGQTPLRVRVWTGYHVLELRRGGRTVHRQHVGVVGGQTASQYVDLGTDATEGTALSTTGTLVITSDPAGAQVLVDDRERGVTPLTIEKLAAGPHHVRLTRGDMSQTREVEISATQTTNLAVAFAPRPSPPATGRVTIASEIPVTVFEGDVQVGSSEGGALELSPGKRVLTLMNETFGVRTKHVIEVTAGRSVTVAVTLPEGHLHANAIPWAEVFVDGRSLGQTPLGEATLPLGRHELLFRHPTLGERRVPVTIRADRPALATVDFTP